MTFLKKPFKYVLIFMATACLCACTPQPDVPSDNEWSMASPESEGIDSATLTLFAKRCANGNYGKIDSFLVFRHGHLLFEKYFNGFTENDLHRQYSVTKTVTAILFGMASDFGLTPPLTHPILNTFSDYEDVGDIDPQKRKITILHLLLMLSGLDWDESSNAYSEIDNPISELFGSPDWLRFVLELPLSDQPGDTFTYNSGLSVLLGELTARYVGQTLDQYAVSHLFNPLGIERFTLDRGSTNVINSGWGLHLRPRDMAKIGHLLLWQGEWQGKQLISSWQVSEILKCHVALNNDYGNGYQTWMM